MEYILEVNKLKKDFPNSNFTLQIDSFSIPYGTIMGLIGENGSGKTTALRCILNTIFKDSGVIKLFGKEMTDKDKSLREDIGVVFDSSQFSSELNANRISKTLRNIYSRWDNDVFNYHVNHFDLPTHRKIRTFSKGMIMKLSIAVALAHSPKLLILDEATSGLDPIVRDDILDILLDFVQKENHSILLSSHITSDLEKITDYITFLHKGQVILAEQKDDLVYKYGVIRCSDNQFKKVDMNDVVSWKKREYQIDVLVKDREMAKRKYRDLVIDSVLIDEIMLLLIKGERV